MRACHPPLSCRGARAFSLTQSQMTRVPASDSWLTKSRRPATTPASTASWNARGRPVTLYCIPRGSVRSSTIVTIDSVARWPSPSCRAQRAADGTSAPSRARAQLAVRGGRDGRRGGAWARREGGGGGRAGWISMKPPVEARTAPGSTGTRASYLGTEVKETRYVLSSRRQWRRSTMSRGREGSRPRAHTCCGRSTMCTSDEWPPSPVSMSSSRPDANVGSQLERIRLTSVSR